jgi:hypothetical protein
VHQLTRSALAGLAAARDASRAAAPKPIICTVTRDGQTGAGGCKAVLSDIILVSALLLRLQAVTQHAVVEKTMTRLKQQGHLLGSWLSGLETATSPGLDAQGCLYRSLRLSYAVNAPELDLNRTAACNVDHCCCWCCYVVAAGSAASSAIALLPSTGLSRSPAYHDVLTSRRPADACTTTVLARLVGIAATLLLQCKTIHVSGSIHNRD